MTFLANDLFRSLALGFLLGSAGMVAAFAAGPAEAAAVSQALAIAVQQ
jgi:hypothetical protein